MHLNQKLPKAAFTRSNKKSSKHTFCDLNLKPHLYENIVVYPFCSPRIKRFYFWWTLLKTKPVRYKRHSHASVSFEYCNPKNERLNDTYAVKATVIYSGIRPLSDPSFGIESESIIKIYILHFASQHKHLFECRYIRHQSKVTPPFIRQFIFNSQPQSWGLMELGCPSV